jgi:hypothetical protein
MHEVVHPISDDDGDTVKEHRVFTVNIVPLQVTNHGVPNLFGAEDIVTTMLENMKPWYEPRNLKVLVAFSGTCWGALKVVRLVIGGATTHVTRHLPSPWFYNGRPSVLEAHHQWHPSMDRWLLPWRQIKRDYDNLELWIENEPLRVEVIDRLHSGRWLHQDTINAFMTLLAMRADQCPEVTYFAHTQVFRALIAHGWQHVKGWFKPMRRAGRKAAKIRVFYFPINVSEVHWIAAKVVLRKQEDNSLQMELFGMDSMSTNMHEQYQWLYLTLHAAFTSEWVEFGEDSFLEGPLRPASAGDHVHVLTRLTTPAQLNGIDCGMFVIRWIECDSLGLPCDYSQLEMVHFRRLTFIELSHGQIIRRVVEGSSGFEGDYPQAFRFKNQVLTSVLAQRATLLNRAINVVKPDVKKPLASKVTPNPGVSRRGGSKRGRTTCVDPEEQAAFNAGLEPLLTSSLPCGVITLRVRESDARDCATALSMWKDGSFKVYDTKTKKVLLDLGGFNTYPKTIQPHEMEQQRLNTLLVTSTQLPQMREHVPGFKAMELELVMWLEQHFGVEVELFEAHGLRQGPLTMRSTGFAVHQDNEVHKSVEYTVVVKLTADDEGEEPSAMHVVGAKLDFVYGSKAGDSACFRAGLYHASVLPRSSREHLKMTFFFRRTAVKARYMQELRSMYTEATFEELGADETGGFPYTIIGTWTSESVNARVRPFNDWLKAGELANTTLGAIVYFHEFEDEMVPFHAALESEVLRGNGHHGQWGLYPCVQHGKKDGPTLLGQMKGALVKGGPFRRGSQELLSKLTKSDSIYLWERKVEEDVTENRKRQKKLDAQTVELMDASVMHRGSVKCINDARGLKLPSGESAKNNVKMEPDGVISINKGVKLESLTKVDRKQRLSEMEFLMDYGNAYFVGAHPAAAGTRRRRRSVVAQLTVDKVEIEETNPEEVARHGALLAARLASVSSDDDDFEKMAMDEGIKPAPVPAPAPPPPPPAPLPPPPPRKELLNEHAISLLNRGERYVERQKRAKLAEAELPQKTFKARCVELPMMIPLQQREELALNLEREKALKVIPITADGNCVFRVLAHLMFEGDDEGHHADVRDAVCNELEADPEGVYSQRFTSRIGDYREDVSYADRVTRMRRLEEWGGEPELAAAASIFGFKIHIHHPFFEPTGVRLIQAPEAKKGVEDVHLVYYGDHYDVAYHELRPYNPGVKEAAGSATAEEAVAPVDEAGNDGDGDNGDSNVGDGDVRASSVVTVSTGGRANPRRVWQPRGQSMTGNRLSSTEEDLRTTARLHGLGLSKTAM